MKQIILIKEIVFTSSLLFPGQLLNIHFTQEVSAVAVIWDIFFRLIQGESVLRETIMRSRSLVSILKPSPL